MQIVLLKLFQSDTNFESGEHVRNWLIHVTVNECRKLLRTPWRSRILSLEEWRDTPVFDNSAQSELFSAVMALPRNYRLAIYLFYYEDLTTEEISKVLSAKPTTVRTWLMRGRQRLKQQLCEFAEEV